ncbi:hypothetical protein V5P93_006247 [Actinokineospora auranticolor]|uniref:Gamma-glutamylcysteine synthetase n=1 Tax=Actinokineospora auranticolor TaxID=155976 RepID=A0A2S6GHY9_9PSEU|nr:glutamate--cysteine ligase [Actinokineospora auranticolor]PPK64844.1 gamma-glutamylcysteine synthetase [Actinokineospora auranticolor]
MGTQVSRQYPALSPGDPAVRAVLSACVDEVREVLRTPGFGDGAPTIGAEFEMFLADASGRPRPVNLDVVATAADRRVVVEGSRHLVEANLTPIALAGSPFTALATELAECTGILRAAAAEHGALVTAIGTLPTLTAADLPADSLTALPRYGALDRAIMGLRGTPVRIDVDGVDPLRFNWDSIAIMGATCSWQLHLAVPPADFARFYNAAQLAIGPALAVSGNSPLPLGHRLWVESRIPLWEQAADDRAAVRRGDFGTGWLVGGAEDLFAELVRDHPPLLADLAPEPDPTPFPALRALRLHQSTVWRWNRPVYDPAGNVRVELRALPSGPTPVDMCANAAFLLGLINWVADELPDLATTAPFEPVRTTFYRAARSGLGSELHWPGAHRDTPAPDLVRRLVPLAAEGLRRRGVTDADPLLAVVEDRATSGRTGAAWQIGAFATAPGSRPAALAHTLARYRELAAGGEPVHTW